LDGKMGQVYQKVEPSYPLDEKIYECIIKYGPFIQIALSKTEATIVDFQNCSTKVNKDTSSQESFLETICCPINIEERGRIWLGGFSHCIVQYVNTQSTTYGYFGFTNCQYTFCSKDRIQRINEYISKMKIEHLQNTAIAINTHATLEYTYCKVLEIGVFVSSISNIRYICKKDKLEIKGNERKFSRTILYNKI
jgi:hypothetical protein